MITKDQSMWTNKTQAPSVYKQTVNKIILSIHGSMNYRHPHRTVLHIVVSPFLGNNCVVYSQDTMATTEWVNLKQQTWADRGSLQNTQEYMHEDTH